MAAVRKSTRAQQAVTRAGTHLSGDYEEALAHEAEEGFDPAGLIRRRAGRPSLAGGSGHSTRLGVRLDDDTYQSIRRLAEHQHRKISDVVREAINRYLEAS
ncbi:MAG TPA: ribbon-helix-helix protein, CopG family [Streptosporangiaceae bacterium]